MTTTPFQRPKLVPPDGHKKVLLHSCCAPCSGEVMEALLASEIDYTIFFYNPNIHPRREYELRKDENIAFAEKHNIPFIDCDYDTDNWFEHGFPVITSSLGISRWKNMNQINESGIRAAEPYPDVQYWTFNWRKGGGSQRMIEISKREHFYMQEYCGCVYSLRDTNAWRLKTGRGKIKLGVMYYGDDDSDK